MTWNVAKGHFDFATKKNFDFPTGRFVLVGELKGMDGNSKL